MADVNNLSQSFKTSILDYILENYLLYVHSYSSADCEEAKNGG